jgi:hypothetical protein
MLILDLLEALQKHKEENIEFYLAENLDGGEMKKLELYICDGRYVYELRGTDNNSICLAFVRQKDLELIRREIEAHAKT